MRVRCPDCGCVIVCEDEDAPMFSRELFDADELGKDPEEDQDNAIVSIQHQPGCEWTR